MNGITELAKMLKERNNKPHSGPQVGKVISPLPNIQVQLNDAILLTAEDLVIAGHIYEHYHYTEPSRYLNAGDEVILIPSADEQMYYLMDKAVRP